MSTWFSYFAWRKLWYHTFWTSFRFQLVSIPTILNLTVFRYTKLLKTVEEIIIKSFSKTISLTLFGSFCSVSIDWFIINANYPKLCESIQTIKNDPKNNARKLRITFQFLLKKRVYKSLNFCSRKLKHSSYICNYLVKLI